MKQRERTQVQARRAKPKVDHYGASKQIIFQKEHVTLSPHHVILSPYAHQVKNHRLHLPFWVEGDNPRFFLLWGKGQWFWNFFMLTFPMCSHHALHVFHEMFSIASHFYLIPFAQSWVFMCYLSMKECSLFVLFCTYEIHQTGMLQIMFFVSLESSRGGGVHQLGFMAFGLAV